MSLVYLGQKDQPFHCTYFFPYVGRLVGHHEPILPLLFFHFSQKILYEKKTSWGFFFQLCFIPLLFCWSCPRLFFSCEQLKVFLLLHRQLGFVLNSTTHRNLWLIHVQVSPLLQYAIMFKWLKWNKSCCAVRGKLFSMVMSTTASLAHNILKALTHIRHLLVFLYVGPSTHLWWGSRYSQVSWHLHQRLKLFLKCVCLFFNLKILLGLFLKDLNCGQQD